jgi:uncharacterized protein (DUF433 family)
MLQSDQEISVEAVKNTRITVDAQIHLGKHFAAGTCIPVQNVLDLVRDRIPFSDIICDYYPDLTREDIRACVQYAIDLFAIEDLDLARPT